MDSYIIRVYRRDRENPRRVAGTVEEVGKEGRRGFSTFGELEEILCPSGDLRLPRRRKAKSGGAEETVSAGV